MRVFLSHSSKQKPLVREIRSCLPPFLSSWIDEENLLFGDDVSTSIASTIKSEADYVLLFIDTHAAASSWVQKEIAWAMEAEKTRNRTILLPVVIEDGALEAFGSVEFRNRKYLHLADYQASSVRQLGRSIADSLFALVCRDMQRLHAPELRTTFAKLADSDAALKAQAALIHKIVFPHRQANPISTEKLLEVLNSHNHETIGADEFELVLGSIVQRNLIPGLRYDGLTAYLLEEHAQWKAELNRAKKERVGKRAVGLIPNGARIALDAGSTIEELVRLVCKRIETRAITKLTVATSSANIADMVSDCCVKMGFDDDFSAVTLLVPGGRIRPNTQAIVPLATKSTTDIVALGESVGGFDIAFVGVNGIDADGGMTTHDNAERANKSDLLAVSRRRVILGDSSKLGIVLEERFARFEDDLTLVIDDDPANPTLQELMLTFRDKIVVA